MLLVRHVSFSFVQEKPYHRVILLADIIQWSLSLLIHHFDSQLVEQSFQLHNTFGISTYLVSYLWIIF
jgi:hypothetical protein